MNAIRLTVFGTPATLHEQALPDPQVVPGTVRVGIRAAAVNPLEIELSTGAMQKMMPLTLP